uniref:Uncharacterized protein n=1 Tax=Trypanosoma congolense (strain IL3000) TaxID=1068625 RepID=G0UTD4_TRYCI|nr:conserved hypothetical protein [Trypanosoma congolense IL3000]
MPNPYYGNDDAARYVEYYASPQMMRDSVHRLHTLSIQRHIDSVRRAEALYQRTPPAAPVRTKQQIEEHVNQMVYAEVFRRKKKLMELAWNINKQVPPRYIKGQELEYQVHRLYKQQVQNLEQRRKERRRRLGILTDEELRGTKRGAKRLKEREEHRMLESRWRTPSSHSKYNDGEFFLVAEYGSKTRVPASQTENLEHLSRLAKPLRPREKVRK